MILCSLCGTLNLAVNPCQPCRDVVSEEAALSIYFWSRVQIVGECWEWIGPWHGRYGQAKVRINGRKMNVLAHRLGYQIQTGKTCDAPALLHVCDNRRCVRRAHLREGSQADNVADMIAKGRAAWQAQDISVLVSGAARGPVPWAGA